VSRSATQVAKRAEVTARDLRGTAWPRR
jgi:hypothetical protein